MRINFDVEEAKAALDKKILERPDHLMALHPKAKPALLEAWLDWCDDMAHLRIWYEMAVQAQHNQWRDEHGELVASPPWKGQTNFGPQKSRAQRAKEEEEETKAFWFYGHRWTKEEAAAAGHKGGRPMIDNPSKRTLQARRARAKRAACKLNSPA